MKIEIKCRFSGSVLFSHEAENNTTRLTVEAAVSARANLARANLAGASLAGASLDGAYLARANLARASLARANLDGANLDGANLDGASLDGEVLTKAPLSLLNLTWPVLITEGYMRIGCQRHSHTDWESFDADAIRDMESRAPGFWQQWRDVLLATCKQHAAKEVA